MNTIRHDFVRRLPGAAFAALFFTSPLIGMFVPFGGIGWMAGVAGAALAICGVSVLWTRIAEDSRRLKPAGRRGSAAAVRPDRGGRLAHQVRPYDASSHRAARSIVA